MPTTLALLFILVTSIILTSFATDSQLPSTSSSLSSSTDSSLTLDPEFKRNAQEYVRLFLIEELTFANQLVETPKHRNKLRLWEKKVASILKNVLVSIENDGRKIIWYTNWRERLQYFEKLGYDYFRGIVNDYGESPISWPKFTFDPVKSIVIEHPSRRRSDDDADRSRDKDYSEPIATDEEIDRILRLHVPYTDHERQSLLKNEATLSSDEFYKEAMNIFFHKRHEIEHYRTLLDKHQIINLEMIYALQRMSFTLLRESLKGKHRSDLLYQEKLLRGKRVMAQVDLWKRYDILENTDINNLYYDHYFPDHLRVLKNDNSYRKYLNFHDEFFKGNFIYGYKDRLDNPNVHGLGFDINAKTIIGKRHRMLHDLYNDMFEFKILTDNFKHYSSRDLPLIDSYMERFKTWTFWFPQCKFDARQWISTKIIKSDNEQHVVIPKNVKFIEKPSKIFVYVTRLLKRETKIPENNFLIDSMHKISKAFKVQTMTDAIFFYKIVPVWGVNFETVIVRRAESFFENLKRADQLQHLITLKLPLQVSLSVSSLNKDKKLYNDERKIIAEKDLINVQLSEEAMDKVQDLFDLNSNPLTQNLKYEDIASSKDTFSLYSNSDSSINSFDSINTKADQDHQHSTGGDLDKNLYNPTKVHMDKSNNKIKHHHK